MKKILLILLVFLTSLSFSFSVTYIKVGEAELEENTTYFPNENFFGYYRLTSNRTNRTGAIWSDQTMT